MVDINKDESVHDANPHDLREHFEFTHAIVVAMGSNCPTAEWRSWEDMPGNVKKVVMDGLLVNILLMDQ
ncbi:serine hydroxymethyltransferase 7-like [Pyrus ussuriensis x Pyrus communis]|uniref:Serine hydroxymethyltransferase 7-like n=1 Tax=Pyrus ussuriensis x Pyrus communis TaxID=2448454 RepID=A0A5N5HXG3_9ROSA|nr:serine hydroxymethyltransferase 7-like [Pyrus ussuriensis x Pyrus communis]